MHTDPSLTTSNLTSALESLPDRLWRGVGRWMRVPVSTLDKIESQFHTNGEKKAALLRVFVTEHPEPTWEHVSEALYRMGHEDLECHRTLDIVQSRYPTGESLTFSSTTLPSFLISTIHTNTFSSSMYTISLSPSPPFPVPLPLPLSFTPVHTSYICAHVQAGVKQIVPVCTCMFPLKITGKDLACSL